MRTSRADIDRDLRDLQFAAEWPDSTIAEVASLAAKTACPAGALIFREGEKNQNIHFVLSGLVSLEMSVPARGSVRLLTIGGGDLLGWSPLVGNTEMTATAVAIEPTKLLTIPGEALLALCDRNHEIGFAVMRRLARALSQRLTATRLQLLDLFTNSAPDFVDVAAGKGNP